MLGELDTSVRLAAFQWLAAQADIHGETLPRALLAAGFDHRGVRVPLLGPQGIFKPRVTELPISITTSPNSPYGDRFEPNGVLRYSYRGADPLHADNVGLRRAIAEQAPLVYFHGLRPGRYLAHWPVYVVGDDPAGLTFTVQFDDVSAAHAVAAVGHTIAEGAPIRRAYITATVRRRLHQQAFRDRVLNAYRDACALCRLRHQELLDAAHIVADAEGEGDPVIANGLALCKLHHAAYDRHFLSVRPDYIVEVRTSILTERDGPMLLHGLQGLQGQRIQVPGPAAWRPDPNRLAARHRRFLEAN